MGAYSAASLYVTPAALPVPSSSATTGGSASQSVDTTNRRPATPGTVRSSALIHGPLLYFVGLLAAALVAMYVARHGLRFRIAGSAS